MKRAELQQRLVSELEAAGVNIDSPSYEDVDRAWQAMLRFASEPVEGSEPPNQDGDGLLAQYGTYDWGDGLHFELDITRQLVFYEAGEYKGMAQINCTFQFPPLDELRALPSLEHEWSFQKPLDRFFQEAMALPGFASIRRLKLAPTRLIVDGGDV